MGFEFRERIGHWFIGHWSFVEFRLDILPTPRRQCLLVSVPCRLTRPRAPDSVPRARALALGNPATRGGTVFPRAPGPFVVFSSARVRHPGFSNFLQGGRAKCRGRRRETSPCFVRRWM